MLQAYYLPQKRAPFFDNTRANTQQVLPMQIGLYRYDEWMAQEINDEKLMLTQFNVR